MLRISSFLEILRGWPTAAEEKGKKLANPVALRACIASLFHSEGPHCRHNYNNDEGHHDKSSSFVASLLCCSLTTSLRAQTLYSDDFGDGVADGWITEDLNDPSFGPGTFDAGSGAFVLGVTGEMPAGFAGSHGTLATLEPTVAAPLADGYFQGTVRANTDGSTVSLLSRADPALGTDYGFFASTLHGTFGIEVFDASKSESDKPACIAIAAACRQR